MAKDGRVLREEAAEATAAGKYKRALSAYLELERIEPRDAQWAKRAGETYRKLGNNRNAIEAFDRSVDRYAQNGFLVQAIAVCKLILQIDPTNANALQRLAQLNDQSRQGPTRAYSFAENNPALHANPNVAAIRRTGAITALNMTPDELLLAHNAGALGQMVVESGSTSPENDPDRLREIERLGRLRGRKRTTQPPIAVARTKSKPFNLPLGMALDQMNLASEMEKVTVSSPGVHVIPLDDDELLDVDVTQGTPPIELDVEDALDAELDEVDELDLADIEEIPLPQPRAIGMVAARALAATPLFAGLPREALEALVSNLTLVPLEANSVLFREGDAGDALYVIVEGEVSVQAEGPPRVEMARLGAGAFIGEVALMTDQPRSATVTATQTSELLRIDRNTLSRVLADHGDVLRAVLRFVRDRLVDRWMRTSPLFRPFSEPERKHLVSRFKFLEIEQGTKLLVADSRPDGLYIVLAGHFEVQRAGLAVATLGPGDLIGETSLLSGGPFKSDVVARGKALALCLPAKDFREVIMTHPHVLEVLGESAEHSRKLQIL